MSRGIQYRNRVDLTTAIRRQKIQIPKSTFLQIVSASSASATLGIAIDNDVSNSKFFDLKRGGEIKEGDGFDTFYIKCEAQAGEWVDIIAVESTDDFYVKNPQEAIVNEISSAVKVINDTGDTLLTNNTDLEALLKNDEDLRQPISIVGSNVVGSANNASVQTLVTPAVNTAGIIIRTAVISSNGSAIHTLYADTSAPSGATDITKNMILTARNDKTVVLDRPVFIPAGHGIYSDSTTTGTSDFVNVSYDVL